VERAFGTLQDRLVKELRLAGISTVAAANEWLPGLMTSHNDRFGRAPANAKDLHRKLTPEDDLDEILAWREERTVTRNLTLHYDRMMLMLDSTPFARSLARKKVEVVNYPDGRFAIRYNGTALPFRMFDKIQTVEAGAIVENKRLGAVLALVKEQQAAFAPHKRRYDTIRDGNGHRIIWRRPACPRRAGLHGETPPRLPPEPDGNPLVFRYVTENDHAKRPQTRGRHVTEQRRTTGPLPGTSSVAGTIRSGPRASADRPPSPSPTLARCRRGADRPSGRLCRLARGAARHTSRHGDGGSAPGDR
jgi:hypothetical protein